MQAGSYRSSSNRERASERQRKLAVNQSGPRAHHRFESCRSHLRKPGVGISMPPSPNWSGTGLLSRACRFESDRRRQPRGSEALTAKHSALNRANGVRLPADPRLRDSGSANGRPLRSERRNRGSSPRPETAVGDRPMAGRQALTLQIEVRPLVPERILHCATKQLSDNRIVDDARGRAPPRPQLALVADLVMAPARRAGDAGSIPDEGTIGSRVAQWRAPDMIPPRQLRSRSRTARRGLSMDPDVARFDSWPRGPT